MGSGPQVVCVCILYFPGTYIIDELMCCINGLNVITCMQVSWWDTFSCCMHMLAVAWMPWAAPLKLSMLCWHVTLHASFQYSL